jgi:Spy/CpxP family protein refolding chaperone
MHSAPRAPENKNMRTFTAALASLFVATTAPAALAEGPGHTGDDSLRGFKTLLKTANLTSDQQAQVHQLMTANWVQTKQLHAQIRALRQDISDKLASTGAVSASDISPIQQQIAQLRDQIEQQAVQAALQIRTLLTAGQLSQMSQANGQIKNLHAQLRAVVPGQTESGVAPERLEIQ